MKNWFLFLNSKIQSLISSVSDNSTSISNINSSLESINGDITNINNDLYIKSGDTMTSDYIISDGFITTSAKKIFFNINLHKNQELINTITINAGSVYIRGIGGVIEDSVSNPIDLTSETYTVSITPANDYEIMIGIEKSSAFSSATNNTPVSILITGLSLTFSVEDGD